MLTYSNWESGTVCFSESYESLSEGLQAALWELGAVPAVHQTDRMTAAVCHPGREVFTQRYAGLLRHYGLEGRYCRVQQPNENGDIEQRHHRFKRAVDQALMLRGSKDFASRADYESFLRHLFTQLNAGRTGKLEEERTQLRPLPPSRLDCFKKVGPIRVTSGSTIKAGHNIYSVDSRLIGENVTVHLYAEHLEVWYAQRCLERIPRLRGDGKHRIQYRHVINWLVRKPAAFENYRYRADLFPSSRFRRAYDELKGHLAVTRAAAAYLAVLKLAGEESEDLVDRALGLLFDRHTAISLEAVAAALAEVRGAPSPAAGVTIAPVDVGVYDGLLENEELSHAAAV